MIHRDVKPSNVMKDTSSTHSFARDPVCDMLVDTATATLTSVYMGRAVYLCAPGCKWAFDKNPSEYEAKLAAG